MALASLGTSTLLPPELPLAHLTAARWLMSILDAGRLLPRSCKVFNEDLIYFSYGGVFYRTSKLQTENTSELPVAMVFRPQVLDLCGRLFPFDSGAMAGHLFGTKWDTALSPFQDRFSVRDDLNTAARLLVHCCYRENSRYVEGKPASVLGYSGPSLNALYNFLSEDLSGLGTVSGGIDHRQRSIELLSSVSVPIANELIWIGLPHSRLSKTIKAIRRLTRTMPQVYTYHFRRNFYPDEYAAELEVNARAQAIDRYLK